MTRKNTLLLKDCPTGGCGAKIGPAELSGCLHSLPPMHNPDLLVGFGSSDDAAVYRLSEQDAIVSTVDFFPPMVDDPRTFGRIAAANALSDIYAMGGVPLFGLNLVCFPQTMDKAILGEILAGGAEKIVEAGAVVAGGHSIYDSSLKYGLAVTGRVNPDKFYRNNACQPGDCLILTKPLGVGLILSAARAEAASADELEKAIASMERLSKYAAEKLAQFTVHSATDITGFGLLVHASEMAGADTTLTLHFASLPLLPGALNHAAAYLATAAGQRNRNHLESKVDISAVAAAEQEILYDPQTSGGLLISVAEKDAATLCDMIRQDDPSAAIIGQVTKREKYSVRVI